MSSVIIRGILPPLSGSLHKGSLGRIGIVGGCTEYTGAPYFAAMTALRLGADLATVLCTEDAAAPIKSYAPELMVNPVMRSLTVDHMSRFTSVVIGCGGGRDNQYSLQRAVELACSREIPIIIDGDGLFALQTAFQLIQGNKKVILTPNAMEFTRLWNAVMGEDRDVGYFSSKSGKDGHVCKLATKLGGVTILKKGSVDEVSDGTHYHSIGDPSSPKRCGGIGDILAGSAGAFAHWTWTKERRPPSRPMPDSVFRFNPDLTGNKVLDCENPSIVAAYAASLFVRLVTKTAFKTHGRSLVASDIVATVATELHDIEHGSSFKVPTDWKKGHFDGPLGMQGHPGWHCLPCND